MLVIQFEVQGTMSTVMSAIQAQLEKHFKDLEDKQKAVAQQAQVPGTPPPPGLEEIGRKCEELASFVLTLEQSNTIGNYKSIEALIGKLRRTVATGHSGFADNAAKLLQQLAVEISSVIYTQMGIPFTPKTDFTHLENLNLAKVIEAFNSAQKIPDLINGEIEARLKKRVVTKGVADKVIEIRVFLSNLNSFLQQPNTSNQIVLRTLHALAQSASNVLIDIFNNM